MTENKKNTEKIDNSINEQFQKTNLNRKQALPEPSKDEIVTFKMPKNYKELLADHFKKEGLNLSNGVRSILYDYINRNCIWFIYDNVLRAINCNSPEKPFLIELFFSNSTNSFI